MRDPTDGRLGDGETRLIASVAHDFEGIEVRLLPIALQTVVRQGDRSEEDDPPLTVHGALRLVAIEATARLNSFVLLADVAVGEIASSKGVAGQ